MTLILGILLFSQTAWAFPELVRHNYVNCTSCHVSPTGGGVLTRYGRELSREVLSSAGKEGEFDFAYGLLKSPEWLNFGGELRSLIFYRDSPTIREGKVILMQADLEAVASYDKFLVAGTVGIKDTRTSKSAVAPLVSRRHYLNFRPTDEVSVRAGKFQPSYGINVPDHAIATKRDLGWDQGSETYNLEAAYIGDLLNAYLTGIFGRPDAKDLNREHGIAFNPSIGFWDHYKAGASYFYGKNDLSSRHVFGPWGIFGFTPHFYLLTELDFQRSAFVSTRIQKFGFVNYQKLGYEFVQGLHGFLTQELNQQDISFPDSMKKMFGLGIQYFPRPHFEVGLTYQMLTKSGSPEYTDLLFFLFHFYP